MLPLPVIAPMEMCLVWVRVSFTHQYSACLSVKVVEALEVDIYRARLLLEIGPKLPNLSIFDQGDIRASDHRLPSRRSKSPVCND